MADRKSVVAFINPKSGERAAAAFVKSDLERLLPGRVVDLSQCFQDQTAARNVIAQHAADGSGILVVAGGDGTVSFAMDIVDGMEWDSDDKKPFIGIIPMGTGNDLSRSLGFGPGFVQSTCGCCCVVKDLEPTLEGVTSATRSTMDRWRVSISQPSGVDLGSHLMNNYFSIGFDAHIAEKFDTARKQHPSRFSNRMMNKMWYSCYGCSAMCGEPQVDSHTKLTVDGMTVDLPKDIKSLVVANVTSFAGGVDLWGKPGNDEHAKFTGACINDGKLEVIGIGGSLHMGFMQIKLRHGYKVAQGSRIRIETSQEFFMQYDGEVMPKLRGVQQARIDIEPLCSVRILNASKN